MDSLDWGWLPVAGAATGFAVLVTWLPVVRAVWGMATLGLLAALVVEGTRLPGLLASYAALYLMLRLLPSGGGRWPAACGLLGGIGVIFTAWRLAGTPEWRWNFGGWQVSLWYMQMWHLLRMVNLTWEVGSGRLALPSPPRFLAWGFLPLTLGGPLLGYAAMVEAPQPSAELWRSPRWWKSVVSELAKIGGSMLLGYLFVALKGRFGEPLWTKALAALLGPWGFYLYHAGLFGLMERLGAVVGIPIPESFRWPLFRSNIGDFWANWNMTATGLFRDYVFYNRWGLAGYNMYANTMILFLLVGLWHAANWYWILFGLLHGVYFCVFLATRNLRRGIPDTTPVRLAGGMLTYLCVCAAWYLPSKVLQVLFR